MNKLKRNQFLLVLLILIQFQVVAQKTLVKVACIGDSVTAGYLLVNPTTESYPSQLQMLMGEKYEVKNFGHSGATLLKKGHNPYYKTKEWTDALAFSPDIAIIHLGLNDTDPRNWPNFKEEFDFWNKNNTECCRCNAKTVFKKCRVYIIRFFSLFIWIPGIGCKFYYV